MLEVGPSPAVVEEASDGTGEISLRGVARSGATNGVEMEGPGGDERTEGAADVTKGC
jgi:hypothetical protein